LLTLFGIHVAPFVWGNARINVDIVGFTTVRVDLSTDFCNLFHMTAPSPLTSLPAAGTVLRGVPVVPGGQYGPVIRPGRLPAVDIADHAQIAEGDRPTEAARFAAAATAVSDRLRDRAAHATGAASEVLAATAALAKDRAWLGAAEKRIKDGTPAVAAVAAAAEQFIDMFTQMGGLMAERVTDLRDIRDRVVAELKANHAYFCNDAQKEALAKLLLTPNWTVNPKCVGQAPAKIAQMAGFSVPPETRILVVELDGVGKSHPLSAEKLSPVLSLYFAPDFASAVQTCHALLKFGGLGHTCVIYSTDDARIREYALRMPAMRVLVNTPAPQGSTGITTNVFPSMTLGCGAAAGNITSDNVGPQHLINVKRLAYAVRKPGEAFEVPVENAAAAAVGPLDRQTVVAAVEKYLSQRGISVAVPQPPAATASVVDNVAAEVVDRFTRLPP